MDKEVEYLTWDTSGEPKVNKTIVGSYKSPIVTRRKRDRLQQFSYSRATGGRLYSGRKAPAVSLDEVSRSDILVCR